MEQYHVKDVYDTISIAAYAMKDFRSTTCREGAQGWLFWTWDSYENLAYQDKFYKMTESGAAINSRLQSSYSTYSSCGYQTTAVPRTPSR